MYKIDNGVEIKIPSEVEGVSAVKVIPPSSDSSSLAAVTVTWG